MKGLHASIYQNPSGNFSARGLSSRVTEVTIIGLAPNGEKIAEVFEPSDAAPAVILCSRRVTEDYTHIFAKPVEIGDGTHSMMGGCFIWASDSRFPSHSPIPLHDRVEA